MGLGKMFQIGREKYQTFYTRIDRSFIDGTFM